MVLLNIKEDAQEFWDKYEKVMYGKPSEDEKKKYEKDGNLNYLKKFYRYKHETEGYGGNVIYVDVIPVVCQLPKCIKSKQKMENLIDKQGIEIYNKYKKIEI